MPITRGATVVVTTDASQGDEDTRHWLAQDVTPWLAWLAPDDEVRQAIEARLRAA